MYNNILDKFIYLARKKNINDFKDLFYEKEIKNNPELFNDLLLSSIINLYSLEIILFLLDNSSDINFKLPNLSGGGLLFALIEGFNDIRKNEIDNSFLINNEDIEILENLIKYGIDINSVNENKQTVLDKVFSSNNQKIEKILLENGAKHSKIFIESGEYSFYRNKYNRI